MMRLFWGRAPILNMNLLPYHSSSRRFFAQYRITFILKEWIRGTQRKKNSCVQFCWPVNCTQKSFLSHPLLIVWSSESTCFTASWAKTPPPNVQSTHLERFLFSAVTFSNPAKRYRGGKKMILLEQLVEKNCFWSSWISLSSLGAHLRATCGNLALSQIDRRQEGCTQGGS